MKSTIETFSRMLAAASLMWLGLAASAANANVLQVDGWSSVGGGQSAAFGDRASSSHDDSLSYTLPRPSVSQNGPSPSLSFSGGPTPRNYSLRNSGSTNSGTGSYGGTIIVNPVPEPQTYAMLLIGLVLVAFSARHRKDNIDH